jgi:hypothetical protein
MRSRLLALSLCLGPVLLAGCVNPPPRAEFSPDGRRLVFPGGPKGTLGLVGEDGVVTGLKGTEKALHAKWSPDGSSLAFLREGNLYRYNLATGKATLISEGVSGPLGWSADSFYVMAFCRPEEGPLELCWFDRPAGPARRVELPVEDVGWDSPVLRLAGADRFAFIGRDPDGTNVYTVRQGRVERLTRTGDVIGLGSTPGGSGLLWARPAPHVEGTGMTLWAMDLSTRAAVRLPFTARLQPPDRGREPQPGPEIHQVTFSPDASRVTIQGHIQNASRLYLARIDGSGLQLLEQLPPAKPEAEQPEDLPGMLTASWSADSRRLAVLRAGGLSPSVRLYGSEGIRELVLPIGGEAAEEGEAEE